MPNTDGSDGDPTSTYELSRDEPISYAVVKAVAAVTGLPPVPSDPAGGAYGPSLEPLYDAIDPEILDSLFDASPDEAAPNGRITFTYHGCEVTVHGEGRVAARPLERAPEGTTG